MTPPPPPRRVVYPRPERMEDSHEDSREAIASRAMHRIPGAVHVKACEDLKLEEAKDAHAAARTAAYAAAYAKVSQLRVDIDIDKMVEKFVTENTKSTAEIVKICEEDVRSAQADIDRLYYQLN